MVQLQDRKEYVQQFIFYFITKLAGAGFLMVLFTTFTFVVSHMDLYETYKAISAGFLWIIAFVYGVICSIIIDSIVLKFSISKYSKICLLYMIAGYPIFLVFEFNIYGIIAGTVGAICALLFYGASLIANHSKGFAYVFAFLLPILLLIVIPIDFTEKEGWNEIREETSYKATFDYFHGEHEIPLKVEKGQTVTVTFHFVRSNDGGFGYKVTDENGDFIGLIEHEDYQYKFRAEETEEVLFVVSGEHLQGCFTVNWVIE